MKGQEMAVMAPKEIFVGKGAQQQIKCQLMSNSSTDIRTTAVGKTQPSVPLAAQESFCVVTLCKQVLNL